MASCGSYNKNSALKFNIVLLTLLAFDKTVRVQLLLPNSNGATLHQVSNEYDGVIRQILRQRQVNSIIEAS